MNAGVPLALLEVLEDWISFTNPKSAIFTTRFEVIFEMFSLCELEQKKREKKRRKRDLRAS
jgi:hypothetical protein